MAKEMNTNGASIEFVAKCLKQSIEETQEMIDLTADHYRTPFW
jgi:hypothetical protein